MKLNGFVGKGSGKLGASVFAISGGEQIVRQYNPQVANPQTDAQVEQRAKLKLMSQVAASLESAIAIKKQGLKSARNLFISKNFPLCTYSNGKASVEILSLALTLSDLNKPSISTATGADDAINCSGAFPAGAGIDKVVLVGVGVNGDDKLNVIDIKTADVANDGTYSGAITGQREINYIFAYGVKFDSTSAKTRFEDYVASTDPQAATLDIIAALSVSAGTPMGTSATTYAVS